ncbi:MAG: hypothetical protein WKF37_24260 [Bryobacteraceae bacterium]
MSGANENRRDFVRRPRVSRWRRHRTTAYSVRAIRKLRNFDSSQYQNWYGYREFSRGPHTNLMVHFIDMVHDVRGV